MKRRNYLASVAGLGAVALAGCVGGEGTTVQEEEVVVEEDIDLSKIELDIRSKEDNEWGASESSVTIYPEDNVVCYGEGDGKTQQTGCVQSPELTEKYLEIYRRERDEES